MIDRLFKAGADPKRARPERRDDADVRGAKRRRRRHHALLAAGADVNAREKLRGTTALMWAAEQRHPEAVKALLAAGADPAIASARQACRGTTWRRAWT